jgi:hypothetical protein
MSLFSFIRSGSLLEMLSDILDTVEQSHTVSIEFTVKREEGLPIGLEINLQYYLAEQKETSLKNLGIYDVEKPQKRYRPHG